MKAWLLVLALTALSPEGHPQRAPVRSQPQTNGRAETEDASATAKNGAGSARSSTPAQPGKTDEARPSGGASQGADESREYWPWLIFGRRLKVTDSLLTVFTFLLIVVGAVTLWHMRESAHQELRSYVFPLRPRIDLERKSVVFILRNSGKTPASQVKCWVHLYHGPANVFVAATRPKVLPGLNSIIQADEETETPCTIPDCDAVESRLIADGATRCIRVQGHLSYKDIFGTTQTAEFGFESKGDDISRDRMIPMVDTQKAT